MSKRKSATTEPSKPPKLTLTECFKRSVENVSCTICSKQISRSKLKAHVDFECTYESNEQCIIVDVVEATSVSNSSTATASKRPRKRITVVESCVPSTSSENADTNDNLDVDIKMRTQGMTTLIVGDLSTDMPYYLKYFNLIVSDVMQSPNNRQLFDRGQIAVIESIISLSVCSQKLFVRLFCRKQKWLRLDNLSYPEIGTDFTGIVNELINGGFVESAAKANMSLDAILMLLPAPLLKDLARKFNVDPLLKQDELRKALLLKPKQQRSVFGSLESVMKNGAEKLLGICFRLRSDIKRLFTCIFVLFSPVDMDTAQLQDDPRMNLCSKLIYKLLEVDQGKHLVVKYDIECDDGNVLFQTKEQLDRYVTSMESEHLILHQQISAEYEQSLEIVEMAKEKLSNCQTHRLELPAHLLKFTSEWVLTRILTYGVDALQRLKRYEEAVEILNILIDSKHHYCGTHLGEWYDRIALNYEVHLKDPTMALNAIQNAIERMEFIKPRYQLALFDRVQRLSNRVSLEKTTGKLAKSLLKRLNKIVQVNKLKEDTIEGEMLPKGLGGSVKTVFVSKADQAGADVEVSSVEKVALDHYVDNDGLLGVHDEGSRLCTIFGLLCWCEIYTDKVKNVFLYKLQSAPLDLFHDSFWEAREKLFQDRFNYLNSCSDDEIAVQLQLCWSNNFGCVSDVVNWDCFVSPDDTNEFVQCISRRSLLKLLERFARDFRHTHTGIPDLTLWSYETKRLKIVEVKGPGDRLSTKQRLWLTFFMDIGVDATVCYVKGKSGRKL